MPAEPSDVVATRAAYDTVAEDYAALVRTVFDARPLDRAVLTAFADVVTASGGGEVVDLGCGPGHVTAHLADLGLDARGIDLSPAMIAVARRRHPRIPFDVGDLAAVDLADGALAGAVAWYSLIHTPTERLPAVFAEVHRVLAVGGHLLIAFQVGDEVRHHRHLYGHDLVLDSHRRVPAVMADAARSAGLGERARLVRAPEPPEDSDQAFLLLRR